MPSTSVVKLWALTVLAKLVVPLVLAIIAPNGFVLLPIAPVNVILPLPPFTVKLLLPLTVLSKLIPLPARVRVLAIVTEFP